MPTVDEKADAYRRIMSHLDFNQAYHAVAWGDATLRRVSEKDKTRYENLARLITGNIDELRRMWSAGNYSDLEKDVIAMVASHNTTYLNAVNGHLECIERLRAQSPLV